MRFFRILFTPLFIAAIAVSASAATFTVNSVSDTVDAAPGNGTCADSGGFCTFRAALMEANALAGDDIISVPAGTYTQSLIAANEDANAGGDWDIQSNVTINGAGSALTIFEAAPTPGTATERVMEVIPTTAIVTIDGVTLRHGNKTGAAATTTRGGGIRNQGTLTLQNSVVTLNNASGAGGVRNERTITLNNVTVSNNACNNGGTTCFGGGMYNTLAANSTVTITNSTFSANTSVGPALNGFGFAAGMGIESATGFNLVISGSTFTNNVGVGNGTTVGTSGSNGNGIRLLPTAASTANITNSTFSNNSGSGGASIQGSGITVFTSGVNGTISGTWDGITVAGNSASNAGGILLQATGGAMNFTIRNSTISGNTVTGNGGAGIFSNVTSTTGAANVVNLVNSTVSGNLAGGNGGGLFLEQPAATGSFTTNMNFSTVSNNRANNDNTGTDSGGGVFRSSGTLNLKNSIVSGNSFGTGGSSPDIVGTVNSQDYNHIGDLTGATVGGTTTNNSTGDAQLGALANNGGPTNTHLPGGSSPVLNSIPNTVNDCGTAVTTDQRGLPRPAGVGCDKGSVEVSAAAAFASISGRVTTAGGRPIANSYLVLTGGSLASPMVTRSSSFGFFSIPNIQTGATYTLTISETKLFTFANPSQVINLTSDVTNANFVASP